MELFIRDKGFYKKVLLIAVPVILQNVISIGINIMDTVMLGSFGEVQLSASSLANQFCNIFQVLCLGMGGGAAVITAQYWGKQNIQGIRQTLTLMLRICVIISLLFTLTAVFFPAQIMRVYTPDTDIIIQGVLYFSFLRWTFLFNGLSVTLSAVLRTVGATRVPLTATIISFFINVFFNWVFIFGHLGAPRLEIQGAAVGTFLARLFEAFFIVGYLLLRDTHIGYRVRDFFSRCGEVMHSFWMFSMPVIISDLLLALGDNVLSMIMGRISTEFVAANAITMVVVRFCMVFSVGLANAGAIITGNTLGEGDTQQAQRQGVTLFTLGALVGVIFGVVIILISPFVVNYYNIADETKIIARQLMLAIGIMFVFRCLASVTTKGVLRGGGDTRFLMVADILFLWVVSIPLGYLAGLVWHAPAFWIYVAFRIEFVLKATWCLIRFRQGKWMKRIA